MAAVISIHQENGANVTPTIFKDRMAVKPTDLSAEVFRRLAPGVYTFKTFPDATTLTMPGPGPTKEAKPVTLTVTPKGVQWKQSGWKLPGIIPGFEPKPEPVTFIAYGKTYTCRPAGAEILKKRLADLAAAAKARAEAEARREAAAKQRGLGGVSPADFGPLPPKVANRLERKAKKAKKTNA
jgi:hypothetical protein